MAIATSASARRRAARPRAHDGSPGDDRAACRPRRRKARPNGEGDPAGAAGARRYRAATRARWQKKQGDHRKKRHRTGRENRGAQARAHPNQARSGNCSRPSPSSRKPCCRSRSPTISSCGLMKSRWNRPPATSKPSRKKCNSSPPAGRFEKTHETIYRGENLDQPTFRRRRLAIRL